MGLIQGHKTAGSRSVLALGVAAVAIVLALGGAAWRDILAWDRDAIAAGELWRLLSGHFVHLGWSHLLLNLAGLAIVWWLVGLRFTWVQWLIIGLLSIAVIDVGFWVFYPELHWYVGLSGMLYGLLVAGLLVGTLRREREAMILMAFIVVKIAWEQFAGPMPGSESTTGGRVIVEAHLYGALGGLLGASLCLYNARQSARDPN